MTTISGQLSHTWKNNKASSRIDYMWINHELILNNIHLFSNKDFRHITNSDHTLLQVILYGEEIINIQKKATVNRRKPRTIYDLKGMDKEKWVKYTQEIERIFKENRIISKIQRIKEENEMNFNDNHLQKIWDLIENSVKIVAKKTVPTKKIKHSSKPIIKNKGHTSSFKDLREVTEILALTKKLQENQSLSPDLQNKINGKIERMIKTYPLLTFENYSNLTDPSDIPWES